MSGRSGRLESIEIALRANLESPAESFWDSVQADTAKALSEAQAARDSEEANSAWFLNKYTETCGRYVRCFSKILSGRYYEAWCELERVEIALCSLKANPFYDPAIFGIKALQDQVARWQSLYPYKVFLSPSFLHKREECSICHRVMNPWSVCEHEVGRVYCGVECCRLITEVELLEVSLVLDPVQKYSVVNIGRDKAGNVVDEHNYAVVRFVADRLTSPFDGWRMHWSHAYHPHELFPQIKPDDGCPCESGRTYKSCCLTRPGVIRPHACIEFEKDPPANLTVSAIAGYTVGPNSLSLIGRVEAKN